MPPNDPPPYYDVSGDNKVQPSDALQVINFLNGTGGPIAAPTRTQSSVAAQSNANSAVAFALAALAVDADDPVAWVKSSPSAVASASPVGSALAGDGVPIGPAQLLSATSVAGSRSAAGASGSLRADLQAQLDAAIADLLA